MKRKDLIDNILSKISCREHTWYLTQTTLKCDDMVVLDFDIWKPYSVLVYAVNLDKLVAIPWNQTKPMIVSIISKEVKTIEPGINSLMLSTYDSGFYVESESMVYGISIRGDHLPMLQIDCINEIILT